MSEQNQDLVKIIQDNQKNQRLNTVIAGLSIIASLIATIGLIWNSRKRNKTSLKVRLMCNEREAVREELRHKSKMARIALERKYLKKEAQHESEVTEFEAGLERKEEKEFLTDNFLGNLKSKGEELIKQGKEGVNKFGDKFSNPLEKKSKE